MNEFTMLSMKEMDNWMNERGMWRQGVVFCGGESKRMNGNQKTAVTVLGKPLLYWSIKYWADILDQITFVTGHQHEKVKPIIKRICNELNIDYLIRPNIAMNYGLGGALETIDEERLIRNRFLLILGDCLCSGNFMMPYNTEYGVFIHTDNQNGANTANGYGVKLRNVPRTIPQIRDTRVERLVEKPKKDIGKLECGMGVYALDKYIFDYYTCTPRNKRTKMIELTDVLQTAIACERRFSAIDFYGKYVNVNYPTDLELAHEIACELDD